MAVHQECYGVNNVLDFTSWVCRACETPDVARECCLCPVKGITQISLFMCSIPSFIFLILDSYI